MEACNWCAGGKHEIQAVNHAMLFNYKGNECSMSSQSTCFLWGKDTFLLWLISTVNTVSDCTVHAQVMGCSGLGWYYWSLYWKYHSKVRLHVPTHSLYQISKQWYIERQDYIVEWLVLCIDDCRRCMLASELRWFEAWTGPITWRLWCKFCMALDVEKTLPFLPFNLKTPM